jgi:hypothetical protein
MEGAHPHPACCRAKESSHPLLHLPRCLVGESYGQGLIRIDLAALDQMRQPVGKHSGLARACSRQDQQGTATVKDGLPLSFVEVLS